MPIQDFSDFIRKHYEIHEWRHASVILRHDFPDEWKDVCEVLESFKLCRSYIGKGGGNKSEISRWFDTELNKKRAWTERHFDTSVMVDEQQSSSPTHSVDCYRNQVALEVEWNNKDPFFDRDLNNFRLLFDLRVVSVGIIVTRADELQNVFDALGRGSSYGASTTHIGKLLPKVEGGGAGGCPVLVFGIREALYDQDC